MNAPEDGQADWRQLLFIRRRAGVCVSEGARRHRVVFPPRAEADHHLPRPPPSDRERFGIRAHDR